MKYEKPPLAFHEQADLLISRGLNADKDVLIARLKAVSYYRLSGYCYPFQNEDNSFKEGANLDTIWNQYTFDRRLRLLVIDAIERVEVSVRTSLIYRLSHEYGPFGYIDFAHLPNLKECERKDFLQNIQTEKERSREIFVERFTEKYGDSNDHLPIWIAAEIMTFGMLLTLFRGVGKSMQNSIAREFDLSRTVLISWLFALNSVRNI